MKNQNSNKDDNKSILLMPETQKALGAGTKKNTCRRTKKERKISEAVTYILAAKLGNETLEKEMRAAGFKGTLTYLDFLVFSLFSKAVSDRSDSIQAFKELRSLAGEVETQNINFCVDTSLENQTQRITGLLNDYEQYLSQKKV